MLQLDTKNSNNLTMNSSRNILINNELLNKYMLIKDLLEKEKIDNNAIVIDYKSDLLKITPNNIKIKDIKKIANEIFNQCHIEKVFVNDNNKILVSKSGINESVEKICNNYKQRELLIKHLKIFSKLGVIIEHAKLVNQVFERKGRQKYISWHYYIYGIIIDNEKYMFQFEVVSLDNGENHYHVQRIKKTNDHCGDVNT